MSIRVAESLRPQTHLLWWRQADLLGHLQITYKSLTRAFIVDRATGVEPASRAWELHDVARTESLSNSFGGP